MPVAATIVAAVVGAGASIYAANQQSSAAANATNTANQANAQTRADLAPYRVIGGSALGDLAALYGYASPTGPTSGAGATAGASAYQQPGVTYTPGPGGSGYFTRTAEGEMHWHAGPMPQPAPATPPGALGAGPTPGVPDFSRFTNSPDYQFAFDQGLLALDRSAAAKGQLLGGGHTKDVLAFANGLAAQQYGNYFNRLMGLAGLGANAAAQTGNLGATFANLGMQGQLAGGAANASAAVGIANALGGVPQNLLYAQLLNRTTNPSSYPALAPTSTAQPTWPVYSPGGGYGLVAQL